MAGSIRQLLLLHQQTHTILNNHPIPIHAPRHKGKIAARRTAKTHGTESHTVTLREPQGDSYTPIPNPKFPIPPIQNGRFSKNP